MKSLVMVAVAALACVAFAEGPEGGARSEGAHRGFGFREGRGPMAMGSDPIVRIVSNPAVAEKIGLSDEQKAKLKDLKGSPDGNRETQKKVREATMKQVELMKAEKIDEAAVMAAIDEVYELRKEMAKSQARRVIAVKSILTPEQVAKAHEELKKMSEARGERSARRAAQREGKGRHGGRGPRGKTGLREEGAKPEPAPEAE